MNQVSQIKKLIESSRNLAIITGAGVSSESGIPTFRGKEGYWKNHNPMELATPQAFQKDARLVHEWYTWRRELCAKAKPNPAHFKIAELEKLQKNFLLITQNVDGLHRRAGSTQMVEIHGNVFKSKCTNCKHTIDSNLNLLQDHPLECPECKSKMRPDIVWFGERYSEDQINPAIEFMGQADLVIIVGTSGNVPIPIQLAEIAQQNHAIVVDINPEKSAVSGICDFHLKGKAGEIFQELIP